MSTNSVKTNSTLNERSRGLRGGEAASKFRSANLDPRAPEIENLKKPSIAEESETAVKNYDPGRDQDFGASDEFSGPNPYKDKDEKNRREREKNRRLGKLRQLDSSFDVEEDFDEDDVFDFLGYLDNLWRKLYDFVEEVVDEFDNWNKWFKKEKKNPPVPDSNKVLYIRDEFNTKRSPHLWKSNPDRKWILTFGHNKVNNVVSSVLYKYQNETISKDA
jgi:hypothetical protein